MESLFANLGSYASVDAFNVFLQILLIDLVLAGDNAIIVGMVASRVPAEMRKQVIFWGIGAAVVMRIGFSLIAVQLINIPGLKVAGALLLLWVVWKLGTELWEAHKNGGEAHAEGEQAEQFTSMRPAIIQIVIADLSMSIDNVLAIASVSRDYPLLLVFGLVLSVALMIFAATVISKLLQRYPWVAWIGLILIFWVAIQMLWEGLPEVKAMLT